MLKGEIKPFSHLHCSFSCTGNKKKGKENKQTQKQQRPFPFPWTQGKWLSIKVIKSSRNLLEIQIIKLHPKSYLLNPNLRAGPRNWNFNEPSTVFLCMIKSVKHRFPNPANLQNCLGTLKIQF